MIVDFQGHVYYSAVQSFWWTARVIRPVAPYCLLSPPSPRFEMKICAKTDRLTLEISRPQTQTPKCSSPDEYFSRTGSSCDRKFSGMIKLTLT